MIYSIGQDKSRVVTNGGWKLPKHVFICLKIFHLTHIKQLSQILNKMRHCKSYQYGLEVEFAETVDNKNKLACDAPYCGNSTLVFHIEWDSLNKINTNLTGSNVVNSPAGIMLQEVKHGLQSPGART